MSTGNASKTDHHQTSARIHIDQNAYHSPNPTTGEGSNVVKSILAICTSNYDKQYDHPKHKIRELLQKHDVPIYSTKTVQVAVQSLFPHLQSSKVINLQANSTEICSSAEFQSKKSAKLLNNLDTVRNL